MLKAQTLTYYISKKERVLNKMHFIYEVLNYMYNFKKLGGNLQDNKCHQIMKAACITTHNKNLRLHSTSFFTIICCRFFATFLCSNYRAVKN